MIPQQPRVVYRPRPDSNASRVSAVDLCRQGSAVISISCRFTPVVVLLGFVGVAACTHSAEECTAADAAQQYAQLLPVATKARDVRPDASAPALRRFTRINSPAGKWRTARA